MIARRSFLATLALLVTAQAVRAQPSRKIYRIGILGLLPTSDLTGPAPRSTSTTALLRGLRDLGYVHAEHFVIVPRGADGKPERYPALAAELVGLKVDVILAAGPALSALKQATSTIPIIMTASSDPVADGYAKDLAHPGGNMTGFSLQGIETTGKQLELVKELVPGTAPVAVIWNRYGGSNLREAESVARTRGWRLMPLEIREAADIDQAFKAAAQARVGSVVVYAASVLFPHLRYVAETALKWRLPTMYGLSAFVEAGGLVSYGPDIDDMWRRAAVFVDKIFKGATPADLPIEQPTKFELMINLKTARALGLTIPPALLLRADEVIQ